MRRVLRWVGYILGSLLGVIVLAVVAVFAISEFRLTRTYSVPTEKVTVPTDQASIVRGQHLVVAVTKCADCHGANLAGKLFIDAGPVGKLYAPNLTRGRGGVGATYSDDDWVRTLRHGVKPDGHGALIMPADEFTALSDADLGAVIAYVKSVPTLDAAQPRSEIGPLGRVLFVLGQLNLLPVDAINHTAPRPAPPTPGPTAAYGAYLAQTGGCHGCHGAGLSGGHVPGTPPDFPDAANLTKSGKLASWTEADFVRALRTGRRPDGAQIDSFMPWIAAGQMTDEEISAVWAYIQTVPARPGGTR